MIRFNDNKGIVWFVRLWHPDWCGLTTNVFVSLQYLLLMKKITQAGCRDVVLGYAEPPWLYRAGVYDAEEIEERIDSGIGPNALKAGNSKKSLALLGVQSYCRSSNQTSLLVSKPAWPHYRAIWSWQDQPASSNGCLWHWKQLWCRRSRAGGGTHNRRNPPLHSRNRMMMSCRSILPILSFQYHLTRSTSRGGHDLCRRWSDHPFPAGSPNDLTPDAGDYVSNVLCASGTQRINASRRWNILDRTDDSLRNEIIYTTEIPTARFFQIPFSILSRDACLPIYIPNRPADQPRRGRKLLCQPGKSFNFREAMDEGKILLFNLSDGILRRTNQPSTWTTDRCETPNSRYSVARIPAKTARRPFYLYLDEFQTFIGVSLNRIRNLLSRSRKYAFGVGFCKPTDITKFSNDLLQEILGNVSTLIVL